MTLLPRIHPYLLLLTILTSPIAIGQSPNWSPNRWKSQRADRSQIDLEAKRVALPAPVRTVAQVQLIEDPLWEDQTWDHSPWVSPDGDPTNENFQEQGMSLLPDSVLQVPMHNLRPHHVIQSPAPREPGSRHSREQPPRHPHAANHFRRPIQAPPATLPEGKQQPTWKTPYSYGYFGASGTRHWTQHHGYRDNYTEWRLH